MEQQIYIPTKEEKKVEKLRNRAMSKFKKAIEPHIINYYETLKTFYPGMSKTSKSYLKDMANDTAIHIEEELTI